MAQGCDRLDEKAPGASEQAKTPPPPPSAPPPSPPPPPPARSNGPPRVTPLPRVTPRHVSPRADVHLLVIDIRRPLPHRARQGAPSTCHPPPRVTPGSFHVSPRSTCHPLPRGAGARGAHRGAPAHRRALGALPRRIRPYSAELAASHAQGARRRFRPGMCRGIRRGSRRRVGRRRVPKRCAATCCPRCCCCCRRHRRCRRQV